MMKTRVLESGECIITQEYNSSHPALDLVGNNYTLDYVVAHSDGRVIAYQDGYDNIKGSIGRVAYGNYVKIDNGNGYSTLYAHMQKGLLVKNGESVKKGQRIGYMWDSGNAYGKHLHFEVLKNDTRINPNEYLNNSLYEENNKKYKIGDVVNINGVFKSSTSNIKLTPLIKSGTITRIIENARNPYLLNNGNVGWVNDDVIVNNISYLSNKNYTGNSIVDGLNQINVDSSFSYRTRLANVNGINNYQGSREQNIILLNKLKSGNLINI